MTEYLYRAFGTATYKPRGYTVDYDTTVEIVVDQLKVLRRTPVGAWIVHPLTGVEKWVATHGRKRFACPTKGEAIESLIQRNKRQIQHLSAATRKATAIREVLSADKYEPIILIDGRMQF